MPDALELVQRLAAARGSDAFARVGVAVLGTVVPSELTTLSVCDLAAGRRRVVASPAGAIGAAERAAFDRHFADHPLVRHHAGGHWLDAWRISDALPIARFRDTALWADYYRRVGVEHAIALPLHVDGRWLVSFVLNRGARDFDDAERDRLDALQPVLAALYANARALDRARACWCGVDEMLASDVLAVVRVDAAGRVRGFSPRAARLLRAAWGRRPRRGEALPDDLDAWVRRLLDDGPAGSALACTLPQRRVVARALPHADAFGGLMLWLDDAGGAEPQAADRYALSPRERDVMRWLAAGKTDRDIAQILGLSVRTVHKLLQRIYAKLGVETRTAAVTRYAAAPRC